MELWRCSTERDMGVRHVWVLSCVCGTVREWVQYMDGITLQQEVLAWRDVRWGCCVLAYCVACVGQWLCGQ